MTTELAIIGLGTVLPDFAVGQSEAGEWVCSYLDYPSQTRRFADRVFRLSSVKTRYSVLPDFSSPLESVLYRGGLPALEDRMKVFRAEAPRLAQRACTEALSHANLSPNDVTHLIVITSTGFFTPGPDADLVDRLGLLPSVERTVVSMGGCSGAFTGFRIARRIVGDVPSAKVLMACVELSTIHLDNEPDHDKIVAYSIFGDACSAALFTGAVDPDDAIATIGDNETRLEYEGRDLLKWDLRSTGFSISLSDGLAPFFKERVADFVAPLVAKATGGSEDPRDVRSWVVHPGGPAILRGIEQELDLKPESLVSSWEVLRNGGNLSSASVLFVLQRERMRGRIGDRGLLLGFGPGLTMEAAVFSLGGRAFSQL
jgi:predicted naringenin-chalcone synthase